MCSRKKGRGEKDMKGCILQEENGGKKKGMRVCVHEKKCPSRCEVMPEMCQVYTCKGKEKEPEWRRMCVTVKRCYRVGGKTAVERRWIQQMGKYAREDRIRKRVEAHSNKLRRRSEKCSVGDKREDKSGLE